MKKIDKEIEKRVIDLYVIQEKNSTDIAKTLGVSFNSVIRIVKRNGYSTRKTSDVNRGKKLGRRTSEELVIDLYTKQNKSSGEIAKELGCTDVTVLNILKDNNIKIKPLGYFTKSNIDEKKIIELYNSGLSIKSVANNLGYTKASVHGFLKRNNLTKPENTYLLKLGKERPKVITDKISLTKIKNKESGLYDHIYLKKTGLTYIEFQKQLPEFKKYLSKVRQITNQQPIKTLIFFDKRGKMGQEGAYQIDHKYSIIEGFKNKISPLIIGHFCNLEMLSWEENLKKQGNCSITIVELKKEIRKYKNSKL